MSTNDPWATPDPSKVQPPAKDQQPPTAPAYGQTSAPTAYGQMPPPPPAAGQPTGQPYYGQTAAPQAAHPYPNSGQLQGHSGLGDYASWGSRVGAYLIDGLITWPPLILAPIGVLVAVSTLHTRTTASGETETTGTANLFGVLLVILGFLIAFGLHAWNRWYRSGKTGQSIGRKALGITMIDERTGQPIGGLMAFVRDLAHCLDSWALMLGWLWPIWDNKRQTFADKVIKTTVHKVHK